jgi:hypothetical protein
MSPEADAYLDVGKEGVAVTKTLRDIMASMQRFMTAALVFHIAGTEAAVASAGTRGT